MWDPAAKFSIYVHITLRVRGLDTGEEGRIKKTNRHVIGLSVIRRKAEGCLKWKIWIQICTTNECTIDGLKAYDF